jgi:thioredoxin-related protein
MKRPLLALLAVFLANPAFAVEDGWTEDYAAAQTTAAAEKKDILLDFTGSDWCGYCIKLHEEVFSKEVFKKEAPKDFVLVSLDYPRETEQPEKLKTQNAELAQKFEIKGYPSIVLLDSAGRPYAATGYEEIGADKYVESLKELQKLRVERDASFAKAAKADGLERAKLLKTALDELEPAWVHAFYTKEVDEIIAADKADSLGMKKDRDRQAKAADVGRQVSAAQEKLQARSEEIQKLIEEKKAPEVLAIIDKLIADEKLEGEAKQQISLSKLMVYGPERLDDAAKLVDEVIAIDPDSETAEEAKGLKERIVDMKGQEKDGADSAEPEKKAAE